jgi:hypothetical protein
MFEYTTTFTRSNFDYDFFIFQSADKELMEYQNRYRNDLLIANGFISMSYIISDDKLSLKVITLWESQGLSNQFVSTNRDSFIKKLASYNKMSGVTVSSDTATLPDTPGLKNKKLSTRMSPEAAGRGLQEFITTYHATNTI